eukprot:Nitzschia sp. Nitz4//scaffold4_size323378//285147//285713//NITZ4_000710-RA/size323378-processed-gene-0.309-mRNA-1//1//CDS//3329553549//6914//frame0
MAGKRVQFNEAVNTVHDIRHIDEFTLDEIDDIWYHSTDYQSMRCADRELVKQLTLEKAAPREYRGLEASNPMLSLQVKMAVMDGSAAVIHEQERQEQRHIRNPELIRRRYVVANAEFVHEAHLRALEDEKEAQEALAELTSTETPKESKKAFKTSFVSRKASIGMQSPKATRSKVQVLVVPAGTTRQL